MILKKFANSGGQKANQETTKQPQDKHFPHTEAFTHRSFYTETPLHTDAFAHRHFYPQKLLHTDACTRKHFTHRRFLHTDAFTHKHFHTQRLLHTNAFTHRDAFTRTCFYTHTRTFTHRGFYTQTLFTHRGFYTKRLLHTDAFYTQTLLHTDHFYPQKLLHTHTTCLFTHTCSETLYRITDVECIARAKTLQFKPDRNGATFHTHGFALCVTYVFNCIPFMFRLRSTYVSFIFHICFYLRLDIVYVYVMPRPPSIENHPWSPFGSS